MPKGKLGLPRLTNLGPFVDDSKEIGELVFRGSNLGEFNEDEFSDNTVDGKLRTLYVLDTYAAAKRYGIDTDQMQYKVSEEVEESIKNEFRLGEEDVNKYGVDTGKREVPVEELKEHGLLARTVSEHVTGGLTTSLGTSMRFSTGNFSRGDVGTYSMTLFLEKNMIPARLIKAEYTAEFKQEHPLIAGAADKGSNMFAVPKLEPDGSLGYFTAYYAVGEDYDTGTDDVVKWFQDPLSNYRKLETEQELFAYSNEIDLDSSLFAVCSYVDGKRLRRIIEAQTGDGGGTVEKLARQYYDIVKRNMVANQNRLVVCVAEERGSTGNKSIRKKNFTGLYDGRNWTESYKTAVPFTDPSRF